MTSNSSVRLTVEISPVRSKLLGERNDLDFNSEKKEAAPVTSMRFGRRLAPFFFAIVDFYLFREARNVMPLFPTVTGACKFRCRISLCWLLHWKPFLHPPLLAFGIVRHVGVAHGRQFTGGVFAGVSMRVRTVGHDFSILIGQHLRCKFLDFVRWNVQGSGKVSLTVAFGCKRLNHVDTLLPVELGFQVFRGNSVFHADLLENLIMLIGAPSQPGWQF